MKLTALLFIRILQNAAKVLRFCPNPATDEEKREMRAFSEKQLRSAEKVAALYSLLAAFLPKMKRASSSKSSELVIKVKKYISEHPKETVKEVAKIFTVSESGL